MKDKGSCFGVNDQKMSETADRNAASGIFSLLWGKIGML